MTILAIFVAALLCGVSNFAHHSAGVGSAAPARALPAAPGIGGGVTVLDVSSGGPTS